MHKAPKYVLSNEGLVGDLGSNYVNATQVAKQLKHLFDNPKIILIIREQTSMIESMYRFWIKCGNTYSIEKFLRFDGEGFYTKQAKERFLRTRSRPMQTFDIKCLDYSKRVKAYYDIFGKENVLVLPFEMMKTDMALYLKTLFDFMELPVPAYKSEKALNTAFSNRMIRIARILNRAVMTDTNGLGFLPYRMQKYVPFPKKLDLLNIYKFLDSKIGNGNKPFNPSMNDKIRETFTGPNKTLSNLIGIDLGPYGYY